jgi:hypothetical protein
MLSHSSIDLAAGVEMRMNHKRLPVFGFLVIFVFIVAPTRATAQSKMESNGEGTIKIGQEVFKLYAVLAKLFDNGVAELHLATDITIILTAKWFPTGDEKNAIDLEITGAATKGRVTGTGKLFLSADHKSIDSLRLLMVNTVTRRNIEVDFVGK